MPFVGVDGRVGQCKLIADGSNLWAYGVDEGVPPAALGPYPVVLQSTDGGNTWARQDDGNAYQGGGGVPSGRPLSYVCPYYDAATRTIWFGFFYATVGVADSYPFGFQTFSLDSPTYSALFGATSFNQMTSMVNGIRPIDVGAGWFANRLFVRSDGLVLVLASVGGLVFDTMGGANGQLYLWTYDPTADSWSGPTIVSDNCPILDLTPSPGGNSSLTVHVRCISGVVSGNTLGFFYVCLEWVGTDLDVSTTMPYQTIYYRAYDGSLYSPITVMSRIQVDTAPIRLDTYPPQYLGTYYPPDAVGGGISTASPFDWYPAPGYPRYAKSWQHACFVWNAFGQYCSTFRSLQHVYMLSGEIRSAIMYLDAGIGATSPSPCMLTGAGGLTAPTFSVEVVDLNPSGLGNECAADLVGAVEVIAFTSDAGGGVFPSQPDSVMVSKNSGAGWSTPVELSVAEVAVVVDVFPTLIDGWLSACFTRRADQGTFFVPGADYGNCWDGETQMMANVLG